MSPFNSDEFGQRDVGETVRGLRKDMKTWRFKDYAGCGCGGGCLLFGLLGAFFWSGVKFDWFWSLVDGLLK